MELYQIDFKFFTDIDEEEEEILEESDEDTEDDVQEVSAFCHVLADCIHCAISEAEKYLDPRLGEDSYRIISVSLMQEVHIVNFPGDEDELTFKCTFCKKEVSVPNTDWDTIECPNCKNKILRDRLIEIGQGKWMLVSVKDDEKK